jgi:hypothetical protein
MLSLLLAYRDGAERYGCSPFAGEIRNLAGLDRFGNACRFGFVYELRGVIFDPRLEVAPTLCGQTDQAVDLFHVAITYVMAKDRSGIVEAGNVSGSRSFRLGLIDSENRKNGSGISEEIRSG